MMGVVLVSLDVSVVNVALIAFRRSFAVRLDGLQWVLNVYTLTYAVLLLSAGALSDRLGSRTVFVIGSAVFTTASLLCGLAPSFAVLLVARTVQGVGAALLVPSSMALLQQTFPDARARARAVGLWAGAGSLAIAGGPVLGGALIAYVGWRAIFLINLPFGLLGGWLARDHAPRPTPASRTGFDLPGQLVAVLALTMIVGALTEVSAFGWSSPWVARLVEAMIAGLGQFDGHALETMGMERFWHPKMMWYGPGGIGANRGIAGFQDYHQRPFLVAFPDRKGGNHKCRLGDGAFFATTGWPSVTATHAGPYLGAPATNRRIGMRVMDWWRRDDAMLRENWVFIDIPDLFLQFGVDLFAQMRALAAGR